ncbi:hypothetical protein B0H10DRAFT_2206668 [Mycena sp. CBHHK59/15]|nr:hypothetical protein B0H10DRAFT_2206668 [Mycena sp. CBHHK59/15]
MWAPSFLIPSFASRHRRRRPPSTGSRLNIAQRQSSPVQVAGLGVLYLHFIDPDYPLAQHLTLHLFAQMRLPSEPQSPRVNTSGEQIAHGNCLFLCPPALPAQSENSDYYYDNFNSPSPTPSQTADPLGWESDRTPAPMDSRDVTPTQAERPSSPASVMEISREEFPPLTSLTPAAVTKPRAKAGKAKKGKGKAKETVIATAAVHDSDTKDPVPASDMARATAASLDVQMSADAASTNTATIACNRNEDDPFLAADIARATAASLGIQTTADSAAAGASVLRCLAAAPGSPPKRQRGPTIPAPAPAAAPAIAAVPAAAATPTFAQAAAAAPAYAQPAPAQPAAPVPAQPAAGAATLPPMWLTADGLPPRGSFTPTPVGGFPDILYDPERLLQGVPPELVELYEGVPHPKIFLTVSGRNGVVMRTHGLIREAIGSFINVDPTNFTLSILPTTANGTSHALWLAAGMPDWLLQAILDSRALSSTAVTLYPLHYDLPITGFIGVFVGFTLPYTHDGANTARDLIRTAIQANSEIREFVHTHCSAYGPVSAGEAWDLLQASITVRGIELIVQDTKTVAWRLHVDPPTTNREEWGRFRRLFGKFQVLTLYVVDHPTPLCPFPSTPGWLGPTLATIATLEDVSRYQSPRNDARQRL